ncbi:hypothetical protein ANN_04167 [Periplaneta americana]|uniref:Per a allergen n=1 Tax=Periplaneta americana TaxID=6978 RepID=A0ABQ8T9Q2_PERAM|nr:hypothetical protein ANN_04167 [Periplaneta americana]
MPPGQPVKFGQSSHIIIGPTISTKTSYVTSPRKAKPKDSNSEYNFAVGGFISYHRFNIKEEITWTKFYCTEIVRGYGNHVLWIPITTAWRVLRLRIEETASRYGG